MGNIWLILQIIWQVMQLVAGWDKSRKAQVLSRLKEAKEKAVRTGDTSDLEKLRDSLIG